MARSDVVLIGGSAGSIPVVRQILCSLEAPLQLTVIICLHRMKNISEGIREVLESGCRFTISEPQDKDPIQRGQIYLAPSNYHLLVENERHFALSTEECVNYSRPCIDLTYFTAAKVFGDRLTAVLLSGANSDGASGMKEVMRNGGVCIAQEPSECSVPAMPLAAMEKSAVHYLMDCRNIAAHLIRLNRQLLLQVDDF